MLMFMQISSDPESGEIYLAFVSSGLAEMLPNISASETSTLSTAINHQSSRMFKLFQFQLLEFHKFESYKAILRCWKRLKWILCKFLHWLLQDGLAQLSTIFYFKIENNLRPARGQLPGHPGHWQGDPRGHRSLRLLYHKHCWRLQLPLFCGLSEEGEYVNHTFIVSLPLLRTRSIFLN